MNLALVPTTYAEFSLEKINSVFRLKIPLKSRPPEVTLGQSPRPGGLCGAHDTLDLILSFAESPLAELEKGRLDKSLSAEGPCAILARPLEGTGYELRLSYPKLGKAKTLARLSFTTGDSLIIDHWLAQPRAPKVAARPGKLNPKTEQFFAKTLGPGQLQNTGKNAALEPGNLGALFESQHAWEQLMGQGASALDMNSPELDRFRLGEIERSRGLPAEPIERRALELPNLDIPGFYDSLNFAEETLSLPAFTLESLDPAPKKHLSSDDELNRRRAVEGMNFVRVLAEGQDWLRAQGAYDILERSPQGHFLPQQNPAWWALRGLTSLKVGEQVKNTESIRRGIELWRDGLRMCAEQKGESKKFLEYMVLEGTRQLFLNNLAYAAASMISWAQKYNWSPRAEERLEYLNGEAYLNLGLNREARQAFEDFFSKRAKLPLSASVDRRLVPAAAFRLGDISFKEANFDAAVTNYTKAYNQIPSINKFSFEGTWFPDEVRIFPYALFNRAEANVRLGRERDALKDLRAFLYVAANERRSVLVLYRVGDLMARLGAPEESVLGAWRECAFKMPNTLGARLCNARKAAWELPKSPRENWPRLIAAVEDAEPKEGETFWQGFPEEDLKTYLEIVLADAFLQAKVPKQALFRLDPVVAHLDANPYLKTWAREYLLSALAGDFSERLDQHQNKSIIKAYDQRRREVIFRQTRAELLYYVARAYQDLGLWAEAYTTYKSAEEVRQRIGRKVLRPYEPKPSDWEKLRAGLEVELLAEKLRQPTLPEFAAYPDAAKVFESLKVLDPQDAKNTRLWIRYADITQQPALAVKWWAETEKIDQLSWSDVEQYAKLLQRLKQIGPEQDLLERRVGSWFAERQKIGTGSKTPGSALLLTLAELRAASKNPEAALPIFDDLLASDGNSSGSDVTKPMLAYKKGLVLKKLGRNPDARQSFALAQRLGKDTLWGRLASSAEKEMGPAQPRSR